MVEERLDCILSISDDELARNEPLGRDRDRISARTNNQSKEALHLVLKQIRLEYFIAFTLLVYLFSQGKAYDDDGTCEGDTMRR